MSWFERPEPEMGTEGDVIWRRAAAIVLDTILLAVVTSILASVLLRGRLAVLGSVFGLLVSFAYFIYFEGTYGQTIGKMALDVVVVTEDGDPVDYWPATIRTLLRVVDALPMLYLVGILVIVVTDRDQRLGDVAANTVVVRAADGATEQARETTAADREETTSEDAAGTGTGTGTETGTGTRSE